MSTFTDANKSGQPSLDGVNDLRPEVETTLIRQHKAKKTTKKRKIVTPGEE